MLASHLISRNSPSPELLGCRVPPLCLRMHGGPHDGQEIRLASAKVSIGGAAGCTLRLRAAGSLPLYLWILRGPEGCLVRRFAPQVLLNGAAFEDAPLRNADRLRIGGIELEIVSGAAPHAEELAARETEDAARLEDAPISSLRTDPGESLPAEENAASGDPWARPYQRAFATRSRQTSQQRRSLRRHHTQRTRKLLESLRRQEQELQRLQHAIDSRETEDAARLAAAQQAAVRQAAANEDRIQLEEEARELSLLVEQMTAELRDAAAQRSGAVAELGESAQLRSELARREEEIASIRQEAEEIRRSTAAQIEQLKHAFELVRQERDALASREERVAGQTSLAQAQIESLQAELATAHDQRGALQTLLHQVQEQLTEVQSQHSSQQPQLEHQLAFLRAEIEKRDSELAEARQATASQSEQRLASLDQLRQELAELQMVRQQERQQYAAEAERLGAELAAQRARSAQAETDLRLARSSVETEIATLYGEQQRLQADLEHLRQQSLRERSEAASTRAQSQAEQSSLAQQLERRTADWKAAQQSAAAEAEQFGKTIEQLRGELQSERALHQQETEGRHADRRRAEKELEAAKTELENQSALVAELQRKAAGDAHQWTLQLDAAGRQITDLRTELDTELTRQNDQLERLQETIRELTAERTASQQQLEQVVSEAQELQDKFAADQASWATEHEAAGQLRDENQALREQIELLQASLSEAQVQLAEIQSQPVVAAEGLLEAAPASDSQAAELQAQWAAAEDRLAQAQRQFEGQQLQWQEERDAWEASLRQREEDLAAHVAELERQVADWRERQALQPTDDQQIDAAVAALQPSYAPDAVYGSYTPPHEQLPPDVPLPLPLHGGVEEFDSPAEGSYYPTISVSESRFGASAGYAPEEDYEGTPAATAKSLAADASQNESPSVLPEEPPVGDSDSVDAVLGRLMQAGLWQADSKDETPPVECTLAMNPADRFERAAESFAAPELDPPHEAAPQDSAEALSEDNDLGCTMDASSLLGNRGEAPRSWRAQMLGDDQLEDQADDAYPSATRDALGAQMSHPELPSHEPDSADEAQLPQQAVGHGSWRAQILGAQPEHESAADEPAPYGGPSADEDFGNLNTPAAAVYSPVESPAAEPIPATSEDEDSIEAYMSKLLKRVRGDSTEAAWKPASPVAAPVVEARPVPAAPAKPKPAEPVAAGEFVPQRQAPEASTSLAAMREIANAASRVAIDTHAKQSHSKRSTRRLLKAALALFTTIGFAVWGCYGGGIGPWCGVAVGLLLMGWWTLLSVWHMTKALRLKPAAALANMEQSWDQPEETEADAVEEPN